MNRLLLILLFCVLAAGARASDTETSVPIVSAPHTASAMRPSGSEARSSDASAATISATANGATLERFATDARAVGEWRVAVQQGQWQLRCDARVPNA